MLGGAVASRHSGGQGFTLFWGRGLALFWGQGFTLFFGRGFTLLWGRGLALFWGRGFTLLWGCWIRSGLMSVPCLSVFQIHVLDGLGRDAQD